RKQIRRQTEKYGTRLRWPKPLDGMVTSAVQGIAQRHQHALLLREVLDTLWAVLAADAGVLVAAEWAPGVEGVPVDSVCAGADLLRDLDAARHIGGPYAAGQPIHRVVGDRDRIVLGVIRDDAQHRPEDLLLRDRHLVVDVSEHCGLYEEAAVQAFR